MRRRLISRFECRFRSRRSIRRSDPSELAGKLHSSRAGVSTLEYILILGVVFPLVAFAVPAGKRMIELAYEMMCTLIAWPFL